MQRIDAAPGLSFQHRVTGDQLTLFKYPQLFSVMLNLQRSAARGIGHRIEVAPTEIMPSLLTRRSTLSTAL